MKIIYEVEDGYVGSSRPQHVKVDDFELLDCDTIDEALELINNAVQDDFEKKVSWVLSSDVRAEVDMLFKPKQKE